jgi:hypothetical protein
MRNEYRISGQTVEILCRSWNGPETVLIDLADLDKLKAFDCRWSLTAVQHLKYCMAYVPGSGRKNRQKVLLHRFLMNPPEDLVCHHVSGDGLDNRRQNLRICTQAENLKQRRVLKRPAANKTGFQGVNSHGNGYQARLSGRYLGYFPTAELASHAYEQARQQQNIDRTGRP